MIFLLVITTGFLTILSFMMFKKDVMSPSFLICAGYFISALSTSYNIIEWNVSISFLVYFLTTLGLVSFIIGELLVNMYFARNNIQYSSGIKEQEIKINKYLVAIVIAIGALVLYATYKEVVRIAYMNFASWGNLLYNFKTNIVSEGLEASMSTIVVQANKLTKGFAFVFLFIFANDIFATEKRYKVLRNLYLLIPGILYIAQNTIQGGRFQSLAYILAVIMLIYLFWRRKVGWEREIPVKYIIRVMAVMLIIVSVFWVSKEAVGRKNQDTIVDYVTKYVGGGPQLFEYYLQDKNYLHDEYHETFCGIVTTTNKYGITDNVQKRSSHEFRYSPTGILIGNAYGGFRNFYHDYGVSGIIIIPFLLAVIFSCIYYRVKQYKAFTHNNIFMIILYSSLIYTIIFQFFTDYFFTKIALGFFVEVFLMWVCYFVILRLRIKIKV